MLCASCASPQAEHATVCERCHGPVLLNDRYRLLDILDASGVGITYLARDEDTHVIIKELSFGRMDSLKSHQLFEREARLLQQLNHDQIPTYLDDFVWGIGKHEAHYLVEAYIPGQTLAEEMATHRYDEDEVLHIIESLAKILGDLHDLRPPVIHRDIKPQNIIRHQHTGVLYLIDFGAARDQVVDTLSGTTIVGTFGYMAPEQFAARALPASDIYGLGMLAIELLSQKPLIDMLDERHQLNWRAHVYVRPETMALLEAMTHPDLSQRLASVEQLHPKLHQARHPTYETTALVAAPQTELQRARPESLFGLICLVLAMPIFISPCLIAIFGLTKVVIGASIFFVGVILLTPFLPIDNALPPEQES